MKSINEYFEEAIDIWERLCKLHSELLDLTCEEYLNLLASDLEQLEVTVNLKDETLRRIGIVDSRRLNLIQEINSSNFIGFKLDKASEMIELFKLNNLKNHEHLPKLNQLLISIIEKIQLQNKRNQIFLNKAMKSLDELKSSFKGGQPLTTYGPQGKTVTKTY